MQRTKIDRQVEERLARHRVRYTRGRRLVVGALATADGPRSAAEIDDELEGSIPLSSLYRSLSVLEESGVVSPHHGTRGITRYELAEWLSGHHHHLVCVSCGGVEDIRLPEAIEARLEELVSEVSDEAHFHSTGHSLEIDGRCEACR